MHSSESPQWGITLSSENQSPSQEDVLQAIALQKAITQSATQGFIDEGLDGRPVTYYFSDRRTEDGVLWQLFRDPDLANNRRQVIMYDAVNGETAILSIDETGDVLLHGNLQTLPQWLQTHGLEGIYGDKGIIHYILTTVLASPRR